MIKKIFTSLTKKERNVFIGACAVFVISGITAAAFAMNQNSAFLPVSGGVYREGVVGQPIAINPVTSANPVDLDISEVVFGKAGDIITNYETTDEERVHVIKIKEGAKWSNGRPLTSDDIIFTIKQIQDPETKSPLYKKWTGVVAERVSEIQVRFTLPSPFAFFPQTIRDLPVIPEHIFGKIPPANLKLSDYNLAPVGSGPYKMKNLAKRKDGFIKEIRLTRNEHYPKDRAFIDEIVFIFFETEESRLTALKTRQIDGLGSGAPRTGPEEKNLRGTESVTLSFARSYAIFINESINPALKSQTMRRALRDALDKTKMPGIPIEGPIIHIPQIPPENKMSEGEVREYIEKRRSVEGEIVLNLVIPDVDFLKETGEIIKTAWENAGIDSVNLIILRSEDVLESVLRPGNYEMLLFGTIAEIPEDLFPFWHSSERFYPGLNLSLYKNTRADGLMEKIRKTADETERAGLVEELQDIIKNDAPAIFLYTIPYTHVHIKKLQIAPPETAWISSPSQRFEHIEKWYVKRARIIKPKEEATSTTQ